MITNAQSGTRVDEVAPAIYRISTPVSTLPGGFSFNQYLVVDEQPLLFHTGPRRMFPLVREAIAAVLPVERLRWVAFSHVEADECGSLNELLAAAPQAQPLCGRVAAMVSVDDLADRPARPLADGEVLGLATSGCDGSTPRTCRTPGSAGTSSRRPPGRSSAVTSSPSREPSTRR